GRRTGEAGAELAAQYLEAQYKLLGVQPLPGQSGYRQEFLVTRSIVPLGTPQVSLDGKALALGAQADYELAPFSGGGQLTAAPLVFLGYGITAPERGWD